MYLSNLKSGIVDLIGWLRVAKPWFSKGLPASLCYLCQQPTQQLVCAVCERDSLFFNSLIVPENRYHWPPVQQGLSAANYACIRACGYYCWPLDQLIKQFKHGHPDLAPLLAQWFTRYAIASAIPMPDGLLPVPTSSWRFINRRYHQTLLLAQQLSQTLDIPVYADWARRNNFQRKQQSLGRRERLTNLKRAYSLNFRPLPTRVAIVDDVVTTGATASALSKLLSDAYPGIEIELWALAITPFKPDPVALVSGDVRQLTAHLEPVDTVRPDYKKA